MADENDGGFSIQIPDVAVVSWIPYSFDFSKERSSLDGELSSSEDDEAVGESEFARHRKAFGFRFLFDAGNKRPPDRFDGHDGFLNYVARKEFRGAYCLRNIKLVCDRDGVPTQITYDEPEEYVGYTPIRWSWIWKPKTRMKKTERYSAGIGRSARGNDSRHWSDLKGVVFTHSFLFTVEELGNWGAWFTTGSEAPDVWAIIEYRIDSNGLVTVRLDGSFIPSHRVYVDWSVCDGHDMLGVDAGKIDDFLSTGRQQRAPGGCLTVWKGQGQRC